MTLLKITINIFLLILEGFNSPMIKSRFESYFKSSTDEGLCVSDGRLVGELVLTELLAAASFASAAFKVLIQVLMSAGKLNPSQLLGGPIHFDVVELARAK